MSCRIVLQIMETSGCLLRIFTKYVEEGFVTLMKKNVFTKRQVVMKKKVMGRSLNCFENLMGVCGMCMFVSYVI